MGKSTLLKFIFLKTIENKSSIPILVELRKLSSKKSIVDFVISELETQDENVTREFFERCLEKGVFTFFLDGYDEIADEDKRLISDQLLELKSKASKNRFILSSREESSLSYLADFQRFNIRPLEKDEAFTLIRKLSPESTVSDSLIEKLEQQDQSSLEEFLTNPLLVSLLVKSYLHSPILPVRLSEFYRQVFDALYQIHDARKELGGFARPKRCELDLDRFHKALRALGILTYRDEKLEFTTDELSIQIENAKKLTAENQYSAADFRHDLLHAVPIFVQEGNSVRWAHRSLQEYFAAAYICFDAKEKQATFMLQMYKHVTRNANILRLCADIDEKSFKNTIVKGYLDELISKIENSYPAVDFPLIENEQLERRRAQLLGDSSGIIVFNRQVKFAEAHKKLAHHLTSKNVPNGIRGIIFLDKSLGLAHKPTKLVKYVVIFSSYNGMIMDGILKSSFGTEIRHNPAKAKPTKTTLVNVPINEFIPFNESPNNPINSNENFTLTTEIGAMVATHFFLSYDINRIRDFKNKIIEGEAMADALNISF